MNKERILDYFRGRLDGADVIRKLISDAKSQNRDDVCLRGQWMTIKEAKGIKKIIQND